MFRNIAISWFMGRCRLAGYEASKEIFSPIEILNISKLRIVAGSKLNFNRFRNLGIQNGQQLVGIMQLW